MKEHMTVLKEAVAQLELSFDNQSSDDIQESLQRMAALCEQMRFDYKMIAQKDTGVYYKKINVLPFLYKPVAVEDPFEGNYLERFSDERAYQLQATKSMEGHNSFWKEHNVLTGTVFGSVPVDLIPVESATALKKCGWKESLVEVLDFGRRVTDTKQLVEFCQRNFKHYIMISEEATHSYIALAFNE
jgi:hypothetical protein